jgi:hypothetical protein
MSEPLTEILARFSEDAEFRHWNEGRTPDRQLVYVCQDGSHWNSTLEEWWRFVTTDVRNNANYVLPFSN